MCPEMHAVAKMTNLAKKSLQRFGENLNAPCKVRVAKLTKLANLAKKKKSGGK